MKCKIPFAGWLAALLLTAGMIAQPTEAQRARGAAARHREAQAQNQKPPKQDRRQERQQERQQNRPPAARPQISDPGRGRTGEGTRGNVAPGPQPQPREFSGAGGQGTPGLPRGAAPQWQERLRDMPPEARERFLQNNQRFQNLPPERRAQIRRNLQTWDRLDPQQREDLRTRERIWQQMTPAQREHIRNDVLPQWKQMPPDRKQRIQQRLRILQNMPESARNERLNDPNFTRGMSDQDKAMLRDLSHLHVGGAPDAPND